MRKIAISPRVTLLSGQKRAGAVAQPVLMPSENSFSMKPAGLTKMATAYVIKME